MKKKVGGVYTKASTFNKSINYHLFRFACRLESTGFCLEPTKSDRLLMNRGNGFFPVKLFTACSPSTAAICLSQCELLSALQDWSDK